jgi:hypothetical protein
MKAPLIASNCRMSSIIEDQCKLILDMQCSRPRAFPKPRTMPEQSQCPCSGASPCLMIMPWAWLRERPEARKDGRSPSIELVSPVNTPNATLSPNLASAPPASPQTPRANARHFDPASVKRPERPTLTDMPKIRLEGRATTRRANRVAVLTSTRGISPTARQVGGEPKI